MNDNPEYVTLDVWVMIDGDWVVAGSECDAQEAYCDNIDGGLPRRLIKATLTVRKSTIGHVSLTVTDEE